MSVGPGLVTGAHLSCGDRQRPPTPGQSVARTVRVAARMLSKEGVTSA